MAAALTILLGVRATLAAAEATGVREIRFRLFDERTHAAFARAVADIDDVRHAGSP